jgi:hypothetical protein
MINMKHSVKGTQKSSQYVSHKLTFNNAIIILVFINNLF